MAYYIDGFIRFKNNGDIIMKKILIILVFQITILIFSMNTSFVYAEDKLQTMYELVGLGSNIIKSIENNDMTCFISYNKGIQKTLFNANVDCGLKNNEGNIVIFPIPSALNGITFDIIQTFPILDGLNYIENNKRIIRDYFISFSITQLFPAFVWKVVSGFKNQAVYAKYNSTINDFTSNFNQVTNHSNYYGEIKDIKYSLLAYDEIDKILKIIGDQRKAEDYKSIINDYAAQKYSFLIIITNVNELSRREHHWDASPMIYLSFKTPEIFFPLKQFSISPKTENSLLLLINGFVEIEICPEISSFSTINRYIMSAELNQKFSKRYPPKYYESFFDIPLSESIKYTQLNIKSNPLNFKSDIKAFNIYPSTIKFQEQILSKINYFNVGIFFMIISCISSYLGAFLCIKGFSQKKLKYFLLGLSNIFTLAGMILISYKTMKNEVATHTVKFPELKDNDAIKYTFLTTIIKPIYFSMIIFLIYIVSFNCKYLYYGFPAASYNYDYNNYPIAFLVLAIPPYVWLWSKQNNIIDRFIITFTLIFMTLMVSTSVILETSCFSF